jgi:hypothetical protein
MLALFFFVVPFFPVVLSFVLWHCFFSLAQFFSPSGAIFLHRFASLYNHPCCQQTEGKNNSYTKQWRYLT